MEIFEEFSSKYNKELVLNIDELSFDKLKVFSSEFYKDAAEIYDAITRIKNLERNPIGYDLDEAPILGLLVRIWKILKEICYYYEKNNGDIISLLDRPLIESSIHAIYLLKNDKSVVEDYRKCSYKDRLEILNELKKFTELAEAPPGKRIKASIELKMKNESLTPDSFSTQIKNKWRLQGLSFWKIFTSVEREDFYKFFYGMPSEALHGSWNHSLDFDLHRSNEGWYTAEPFYQEADIRFVTPILNLCNKAFRLWLERIEADDLKIILRKIDIVNGKLYTRFEEVFST